MVSIIVSYEDHILNFCQLRNEKECSKAKVMKICSGSTDTSDVRLKELNNFERFVYDTV